MMHSLLVTLLASTVLAAPSARIKNGLILGSTSANVDTFLGIPYAEPPIGTLRLRRPQPFRKQLGTFNATTPPRACPQKPGTDNLPILQSFPPEVRALYISLNTPFPDTGEDCLTINVQRPANTTAGAKLPVLFWIYGGAWEQGSTLAYNWAAFVAEAAALGEPVIVVEANYRVNTFGFLGGKEVQAAGIANLGLRDQRLALEWVQENIQAFGGDPDKVTLWGQSAGSASVYNHLLVNGGNHRSASSGRPLFSAGIMHSGAAFSSEPVNSAQAQATYDLMVNEVGCNTSRSTLDCLRNAPYQRIVDATNTLPLLYSSEGFYINYVSRGDPSDNFLTTSELGPGHRIADVPLIVGHQEDEGTTFGAVTSDISNRTALVNMWQANFPRAPRRSLENFLSYYNGDEFTGAPFGTDASQNTYPNSKITSATLSDLVFIFPIRYFLQSITGSSAIVKHKSPVWAFQGSYMHGFPLIGSFHGSDLGLLGAGQPASLFTNVVGRYARFARTGVPNGGEGRNWQVYGSNGEVLRFNGDGETVIRDDFRMAAYRYWKEVKGRFTY